MADVQIAVIDPENTQLALAAPAEAVVNVAVPGIQGPVGTTGSVTIAQAGTAATPGIRFESDTNTGIYSPGADQLAVSTGGTGRLFVDASGRVGIGASSPGVNLDVASTTPTVRVSATEGGTPSLSLFSNGVYDWSLQGGTALKFMQDATERLRIDSSGRLGVGTSSPAQLLHVLGSNTSTGSNAPGLVIQQSGSGDATLNFITTGVARYQAGIDQSDNNKFKLFYDLGGDFSGSGLTLDALGNVGIGTTSPATTLDVNGDVTITDKIIHSGDTNTAIRFPAADTVSVETAGSERARIDSSGRLLVGTSASVTGSTAQFSKIQAIGNSANAAGNAVVVIGRGTAAASLASGNQISSIQFTDNGAGEFASIDCFVDATPGASDYPGRLVFSVTADGAASPTEALRISNDRSITVSDGGNVALGTTTGTKIGTATTQKLGFYNATPVVQPTAVADATDAASVITQLNALLTRMRNLGLIAT